MSIYYEETGKGKRPVIVAVHGAGGSSATWFMQLRGLSKEVNVKAIDLNGHGNTPDRGEADVFNSYLEDINTAVGEAERPILMGHSMGSALALLYALKYPDRISGLILVGSGARLRVSNFIFDMLDNDFDAYVDAVGKYMFAEEASQQLIKASQLEVRKCPVSIIRRDFAGCNEFDVMDRVSEIRLPTLIIVGEEDVMTPVKYAAYLHDKIPDSELVTIKGAGHSVMLERPTEMNEAILDWIKRKFHQ